MTCAGSLAAARGLRIALKSANAPMIDVLTAAAAPRPSRRFLHRLARRMRYGRVPHPDRIWLDATLARLAGIAPGPEFDRFVRTFDFDVERSTVFALKQVAAARPEHSHHPFRRCGDCTAFPEFEEIEVLSLHETMEAIRVEGAEWLRLDDRVLINRDVAQLARLGLDRFLD